MSYLLVFIFKINSFCAKGPIYFNSVFYSAANAGEYWKPFKTLVGVLGGTSNPAKLETEFRDGVCSFVGLCDNL